MLHYCTFFDRGKRIEHCQQGKDEIIEPRYIALVLHHHHHQNTNEKHIIKHKALVLFYQKQFLFKHSQENQKITWRSAA